MPDRRQLVARRLLRAARCNLALQPPYVFPNRQALIGGHLPNSRHLIIRNKYLKPESAFFQRIVIAFAEFNFSYTGLSGDCPRWDCTHSRHATRAV